MSTVLVCEERRQVRDGLVRALTQVAGVDRVEYVGYEGLLERYSRSPVDIVLMATNRGAPVGVETARRFIAACPRANVIMFGSRDDIGGVTAAIAAGARGFLRWDAAHPQVVATLAHALTSPAAQDAAVGRPTSERAVSLTEREMQVLRGMSEGKTNGQIGKDLFLSEDTIKTHARRLFRKLQAQDRAEAVARGFRRGLVV